MSAREPTNAPLPNAAPARPRDLGKPVSQKAKEITAEETVTTNSTTFAAVAASVIVSNKLKLDKHPLLEHQASASANFKKFQLHSRHQ